MRDTILAVLMTTIAALTALFLISIPIVALGCWIFSIKFTLEIVFKFMALLSLITLLNAWIFKG